MFQLEDLLKFYFLSDSLSDVNCENCSRTHNRLIKSDFLKEISLGRVSSTTVEFVYLYTCGYELVKVIVKNTDWWPC